MVSVTATITAAVATMSAAINWCRIDLRAAVHWIPSTVAASIPISVAAVTTAVMGLAVTSEVTVTTAKVVVAIAEVYGKPGTGATPMVVIGLCI